MNRLWAPVLALALALASCAAPAPRMDGPGLQTLQATYADTIREWSDAQHVRAKQLRQSPEDRDRFLSHLSSMTTALSLASVHACLRSVTPGLDGTLVLDGELRSGARAVVTLLGGPPGGTFELYIADDLAAPVAVSEADDVRGFWVIDPRSQFKLEEGTLDSRGDARIAVPISDAPWLIGKFRVFQAVVRARGGTRVLCTTPAGGRIQE